MRTVTLQIAVYGAVLLASLALIPFLAGAQERIDSGSATAESETEVEAGTNYNSPPTNRANITNPDRVEVELENGAEVEANYNNSRSNRATISEQDDSDVDGDGTPDVRADDRSRSDRPTTRDTDSDGDGIPDEVQQTQDYNSSRSNKPTRAVFDDGTPGARPEAMMRAGMFMEIEGVEGEAATHIRGEGEVVCWGRAEDSEGSVYAWGRGLCVALEAASEADDTARDRLAALQVKGDEVRSWSDEERAGWRAYRESRATTTAHERLLERMVERTQTDDRIKEIEADDNSVGMRYRAEMRLFGLFPMHREVDVHTTTDGEVNVRYPWYRFLSQTPDQAAITETMTDLQSLLPTTN